MKNYKEIARKARIKILDLIYRAQTSHIGSNFSCVDILAVLFEKVNPDYDEIILSKGWAAAAWYYFLWKKGIITEEELNSFCQPNSPFIGLTEPLNRWGLRFSGGSMGLGFPASVGFALSKKLKGEDGKVYCLMSDGELQCGTTWEASLIASQQNLNNLIVIIDGNGFQAMGKTEEILKADFPNFFGMYLDGHNYQEIKKHIIDLEYIDKDEMPYEPLFFYCRTVKGKGVSFMENSNLYHYKNLSEEEYNLALGELNG